MTRRIHLHWSDVPLEPDLREEEGWVRMQVQFAVGDRTGSQRLLLGRTVLPPGARHDRHRHANCDEFLFVVRGRGVVYTDAEDEPAAEGDVIFTPKGGAHGFHNTSDHDVELLWGWSGAGSLDASGYELARHD